MKEKKKIIVSLILFVVALIYTILVKNIDLAQIGPNGSIVGFSKMNSLISNYIGVNMIWYKITNFIGLISAFLVIYYVLIGIKQFIKEKKVDDKIIILGIFYIVFAIVYLFFEKIIINYRPTLINGELEASYPSSHTLLAICICGSSIIMSKYYINSSKARKVINILTYILMFTIIVGRILSGVHWASDIIGGVLIGLFLLVTFKNLIE